MANPSKRTCVSKSLAEKYEIINYVKENPTLKQKIVCEKFNIKQSTLATYLQRKEKIVSDYERSSSAFLVKRARKPSFEDVDEALVVWYTEKRNSDLWIDGETLRLVATEFAIGFGHENTKITSSWINRWKIRHGISSKTRGAERSSLDEMLNQDWKNNHLPEILRNWAPEDIFSVDETGLYWKLTPDQNFDFATEPKDRVTVLVGASMVGEKLPLLVIGKFDKAQCFHGIHHIPLKYKANRNAWMTSDLFDEWLRELDKSLNRKIILILDNSPAHPRISDLSKIHLIFLPTSSTLCNQPMQCGVIKNLKHIYKLQLAVKKLKAHNENVDFKFNLLDSLSLLKYSWDQVTADTVINCFHSAGFSEIPYPQDKHMLANDVTVAFRDVFDCLCTTFSIPTGVKFDTFLAMDDDIKVAGNITDPVITEKLYGKHISGEEADRDNEQEPQPVSPKDALLAARTLQQYLRQHPSASEAHCSMSQQLLSFLENEDFTNAKQKKVDG